MNNGTDNQTVLGNCPACRKLMQVPVVTDVASVAKCPHCQEKIPVRDLLASIVPAAEIVSEEVVEQPDCIADRQRVYDDGPKAREKFSVPRQLYEGASRRFSRKGKGRRASGKSSSRDRSSRSRTSDRNGSSENSRPSQPRPSADVPPKERRTVDHRLHERPSNGTPDATSNPTVASSPSRVESTNGSAATEVSANSSIPVATTAPVNGNTAPVGKKVVKDRRSSNPSPVTQSTPRRRSDDMDDEHEFSFFDVVKFLFGGLIAAPLAYLALLWVVGVDPFGLAGTFESVSPSLIPEALRSFEEFDDPQSGFNPPSSRSSAPAFGNPVEDDDDIGLPLPTLDPDLVR